MLEETTSVPSADGPDSYTQRLDQTLAGAGLGFSQDAFNLTESPLDRIKVRRVGWQVEQFAALPFDYLPYPLSLVSREVSITTT